MSDDPLILPPGHELPSLEEAQHHIGYERTAYFTVSTIDLGRLTGRPDLFETMVFVQGEAAEERLGQSQGKLRYFWLATQDEELQLRWSSREEALAGHQRILETIRGLEATVEIE